ncbi:hypothetical protein HNQ10_000490 [Deinococcus metallilatus]|uniref:Uncharacterized protein n=1 Tax=Deinococcus metallilatus TaxID=1211322 RepID=A0ABR6MP13_9DEIO|nr:hypothetical protein [Deinococcus metallilatus]
MPVRPRSDMEPASQAAPRTAASTRRAPNQKLDLPRRGGGGVTGTPGGKKGERESQWMWAWGKASAGSLGRVC